jgi:hypothetical protein
MIVLYIKEQDMKVLYSNGDSFVFGMECIEDYSKTEKNKELAFPKHIANKLNCETYINNAYNGATNEFIFRTTIFDLLELENRGYQPTDVFVVIGWTSLHRFEIAGTTWYQKHAPGIDPLIDVSQIDQTPEYADYNTLFVNPAYHTTLSNSKLGVHFSTEHDIVPFCVDHVWHDYMQNPQHEARLIALHSFLNAKGYKHVFLNTCGEYQFTILDNDIKNFYKLSSESFYDWAKINYPDEGRKNNHLTPTPHAAYGNLLVDYIRENIL